MKNSEIKITNDVILGGTAIAKVIDIVRGGVDALSNGGTNSG